MPLVLVFLALVGIAISSSYMMNKSMTNDMVNNGLESVIQVVNRMESNNELLNVIESVIDEDKVNTDSLSSTLDYQSIMTDLNTDYKVAYAILLNLDGDVTASNNEEFIGVSFDFDEDFQRVNNEQTAIWDIEEIASSSEQLAKIAEELNTEISKFQTLP